MTDEQTEPSIWGQPSDIDFLAPATSVEEYEESLQDDCFDDEDSYEEDTSFLTQE